VQQSTRKKKLRNRRRPVERLSGWNQISSEEKRLQPLQARAACLIRCCRRYL